MGRAKYGGVPSTQAVFQVGQISVGTTGGTLGTGDLNSGLRIKALGGTIAVGGSDVTVDTGYQLEDESEVFIDIDAMEKVFVRAASAGFTAAFIAS